MKVDDMPHIDEKEIQKKYMQYQVLKQQIESLYEEKQRVDAGIREVDSTINAINSLHGQDEESMSLLGTGVYVSTETKNTSEVVINVGSGVFLRKKKADAVEILTKRKKEITEFNNEIMRQISHSSNQMDDIEEELQEFMQQHEHRHGSGE